MKRYQYSYIRLHWSPPQWCTHNQWVLLQKTLPSTIVFWEGQPSRGFGWGCTMLQRFCSYLSGQLQKRVLTDCLLRPKAFLLWGLARVHLVPLPFNIYMKPLGEIIQGGWSDMLPIYRWHQTLVASISWVRWACEGPEQVPGESNAIDTDKKNEAQTRQVWGFVTQRQSYTSTKQAAWPGRDCTSPEGASSERGDAVKSWPRVGGCLFWSTLNLLSAFGSFSGYSFSSKSVIWSWWSKLDYCNVFCVCLWKWSEFINWSSMWQSNYQVSHFESWYCASLARVSDLLHLLS